MSPVAKHRKLTDAPGKRRRARKARPIIDFSSKGVFVSPRAFNKLRNNPDFEVLVRIGRVVNALGFSFNSQKGEKGESVYELRRKSTRGLFLMCAYLWEAILVIQKLEAEHGSSYTDSEPFQQLLKVADPKNYGKHKAVVEAVRNNVGFHLDHKMIATTEPISKIEQSEDYDLLTMDYDRRFFYVNIADEIDLIHLADKFRGKRGRTATIKEMIGLVIELTLELVGSSNAFVRDLMTRMKLMPPGSTPIPELPVDPVNSPSQ